MLNLVVSVKLKTSFAGAMTLLWNPLQMLLYKALGFEPPIFGHMSLILAADKSKLSKRCAAAGLCALGLAVLQRGVHPQHSL